MHCISILYLCDHAVLISSRIYTGSCAVNKCIYHGKIMFLTSTNGLRHSMVVVALYLLLQLWYSIHIQSTGTMITLCVGQCDSVANAASLQKEG